MSGPSDLWLVFLIATGVAIGLIRLAFWRRGAPHGAAGSSWRFPALVALNLLAAALLYLTLDPPDVGLRSGHMVVRTAGARVAVDARPGDVIVSLPEASLGVGERVPDLATALRRHPEAGRLRVLGNGLVARDQWTVDRPVDFDLARPPIGFTHLELPQPVAPGARFTVSGSVGSVASGTVELVDPSGAVVARMPVTSGSRFAVQGAARAAGSALFDLRLKDARGQVLERIEIPLQTREDSPPRVVVMAGAPGPELRFLRRWAEGIGIDLSLQLALGAGVDLAVRPVPITTARLSEADLLVIDERRWEMLGGDERAAVRAAVAGGMGLLLRPTGPLSQTTQSDWAALGAPLIGGETLRPLAVEAASGTRPDPTPPDDTAAPVPELVRRDFVQAGAESATLLSDPDGVPLATWRPFGAGRVGVWMVANSYALVLSGQSERYDALWSRMFSVLARGEGQPSPRLDGMARAGQRASLCGISEDDVMIAPTGARTQPLLDARAGPSSCAAIWPRDAGWHAVMRGETELGLVYVHGADAAPSLLATELGAKTLDLARAAVEREQAAWRQTTDGSPWPWFLGLIAALTSLWWLERKRSTSG